MTFEEAMIAVSQGESVTREAWEWHTNRAYLVTAEDINATDWYILPKIDAAQ